MRGCRSKLLEYLRARWYNPPTGTLLVRALFAGRSEQPVSLPPNSYKPNSGGQRAYLRVSVDYVFDFRCPFTQIHVGIVGLLYAIICFNPLDLC